MADRTQLAVVLAISVTVGALAARPAAAAPATRVATVAVPAAAASVVDTGLSYSPGGTLDITAKGTAFYGIEGQPFCAGMPATRPDGSRSLLGRPCPPKVDPSATLATAPIGSLIAAIGIPGEQCSTGWFYAGSSLPADKFGAAGEVYLLYNDSVGHYGDNSKSYTARVTVTPAAHPPHEKCGKVVDAEIRQSPRTPLWTIDTAITLDPARITCPATLTVASGLLSRSAPVCGVGGSAPATLGVRMPVFDAAGAALQPAASNPFAVSVKDAHGTDTLDKALVLPAAPVWFGLGDSYSSAFRSYRTDENDQAFSWVSHAVQALNSYFAVPPRWRLTPQILARSAADTGAIAAGQLTAAAMSLGQHLGSWNIASVTGGGNDAQFAGPTFVTYEIEVFEGILPALNDIADPAQCPTKAADPNNPSDPAAALTVVSAAAHAQRAAIAGNLATVLTNLRDTDPDVRLVDVGYPYVVDTSSACLTTSPGIADIIDTLDAAHAQADQSASDVIAVDLRSVFGPTPVSSGLIYLAGRLRGTTGDYPHPTDAGQHAIARAAARAIEHAG